MKRAEKVARILEVLERTIGTPEIPLEHESPFELLVAVLLSAQTTDAVVNQVTPALFARAPTPAALAALPVGEIQSLIRRIGLAPTKAKHLARLAELLLERHGGQVPRTLEELEALPGVGRKTASVVLCQAFGLPAFPVDTHIHRLAARWGLSDGSNVVQTERDLRRAFPGDSWARLHLQMIHFGRRHCPALRHDAEACPICSWAMPARLRAAERSARRRAAGAATRRPPRAPGAPGALP